jgi:hypothetical protein
MSEQMLAQPVELTDAELDLVTGGGLFTGGLVNVTLSDTNIDILTHNSDLDLVDIDKLSIRNIANHNKVGVGAVIAALGGVAAFRQNQVA